MDAMPHERRPELETLLARARQAQSAAAEVVAHSAALEDDTRAHVAHCLVIRDRVADIVWATHLDARNPGLGRSLARTRRRFAGSVGRAPEIEQAQRIISARNGCSPSEAFSLMRTLSQRTNRKLAVVARAIVESSRADDPPRSGTAG
jgi:AmiR/NasT family two-component response regulator